MPPSFRPRLLPPAILASILVLVAGTAACDPNPMTIAGQGAGGAGCAGAVCPDAGPAPPGTCSRSQPILAGDVVNARDLGGIPLPLASAVTCGAIFRGPPLAPLTDQGCADVAALGLRTVVDLRQDGEQSALPDAPCVTAALVSAPLPIPYSVSPSDYLTDFDTNDAITAIFHTLGDEASYPVYFHCTYGRDRTGVVAAAILSVLGASRDDIMAEYELSAATVGAYPDSLTAVLDEIDAEGGIDAALMARGVSDADLAMLRAHAITPSE